MKRSLVLGLLLGTITMSQAVQVEKKGQKVSVHSKMAQVKVKSSDKVDVDTQTSETPSSSDLDQVMAETRSLYMGLDPQSRGAIRTQLKRDLERNVSKEMA